MQSVKENKPKIMVYLNELADIEDVLTDSKCDIVVTGIKKYSDKINALATVKEIESYLLLCHKNKKQLYVLMDAFIFEKDISDLEDALSQLSKIKIDGIIYNDCAINQINYEKKLGLNLIYDPKALVTNYGQFEFYANNDISSVVLSNEININEITECIKNKNKLGLIKQVSGYVFMMKSRWQLLDNFIKLHYLNSDLSNKKILISEQLRDFPAIIYQNEHGTHIYTGYVLSNLSFLSQLQGIDIFLIDGFLHSKEWIIQTIDLYADAISHINDAKYLQQLVEKEKQINQQEYVSSGFMKVNPTDDLMYLAPKENQDE